MRSGRLGPPPRWRASKVVDLGVENRCALPVSNISSVCQCTNAIRADICYMLISGCRIAAHPPICRFRPYSLPARRLSRSSSLEEKLGWHPGCPTVMRTSHRLPLTTRIGVRTPFRHEVLLLPIALSTAAPSAPERTLNFENTTSGIVALMAFIISPTLVVFFDRASNDPL